MAKIDLSKLKDEIDNRKQKKNTVSSRLGESVGRSVQPKNSFLYELVKSLDTGVKTSSTELVKMVENKAAILNKEKPIHRVNENITQQPRNNDVVASPDRDEEIWREFEKRKKETLAESMQQYIGSSPNQQGNQPNVNASPQQLSEGYLVESVKNIVNSYLTDNFSELLEESVKNAVIEMYAIERIRTVINENKDMIKTQVYSVIRELQSKSKPKT